MKYNWTIYVKPRFPLLEVGVQNRIRLGQEQFGRPTGIIFFIWVLSRQNTYKENLIKTWIISLSFQSEKYIRIFFHVCMNSHNYFRIIWITSVFESSIFKYKKVKWWVVNSLEPVTRSLDPSHCNCWIRSGSFGFRSTWKCIKIQIV